MSSKNQLLAEYLHTYTHILPFRGKTINKDEEFLESIGIESISN